MMPTNRRTLRSNPTAPVDRRPGWLTACLAAVALAACNGHNAESTDSTAAAADTSARQRILAAALNPSGWVAVSAPNDALLQNLNIPADAPTRGMWSPVGAWPMVGVNQAVLPNGKVLTWGTTPDGGSQNGRYFDVWDPDRGITDPANHQLTYDPARQDSFCAPASFVADGRLMITGGNGTNTNGTTSQYYSTSGGSFAQGPSVADERWYAAMVTLADGRSMILGGLKPYTEGQYNDVAGALARGEASMTPEVYENGSWRTLFGAQSRTAFGPDFLRSSLPKVWLAPDGRVFGIGTDQMYYVDANAGGGNGAITIVGAYKTPPQAGATNDTAPNVGPTMSGVMYAPGKVMTVGGNNYHNGAGFLSSRKATSIDLNGGGAAMTELPPMANPRTFPNLIALPPGQVLVTGGETRANNDPALGVYAAEIWDPTTNAWSTLASSTVFRGYHSQSALLPNGTVLVTGGGNPGPVQLKGDVFYPPYLFRTVNGTAQLAPRPRLIGLSGLKHAHGAQMQFDLADSNPVSQVVLIGLSVGTHSFNAGQRRIPLSYSQDGFRITATVPSANLTPPGYYQLVAVNASGVPSRGTIVAIGSGVSAPPVATTAYTPPDTTGTGTGVPPSGQVPPAAAIGCATEGATCAIPSGMTATVWFGTGTAWVFKTGQTGNVACNITTFGDPAVGSAKSCRYEITSGSGGGGNTPVTAPTFDAPLITVGSVATYTATATSGVTYSWNFGDGSGDTPFTTSASTTHAFTKAGVFGVTLTARDASGATATRSVLQAVRTAPVAGRAATSSALAVETRTNASARVWVVNPDNDSVSVIDTANNARVAEIAVGKGPRAVAVANDGRVWVTNKDAATLSLINPATLAVAQTVALPAASRPHGLVFAQGGSAFVALEATGQLLKLDPVTAAVQGTLAVGANPRHLATTPNGATVLVSRFITPPLPGESTAQVDTTTAGAEVLAVNAANLTVARTVVLRHSDKVDNEVQGAGIPNYLGAAAVSPDGASAWVPSKQDNIKRGTLRNGQSLNFQNTVRAISSRIDLGTLAEDLARRVDHDNSSLGSAAVFHPSGSYLFVALETSRQVALLDPVAGRELLKVDVGRAPQAVAVGADGTRLYVQNFMDRSVTVLDLAPLVNRGQLALPLLTTVNTVGTEKLPAAVLLGKQLFHDARDPRLARDSYMSCASCHSEAGHDGRTWDFTGFGEGLRNTPSLKGRAGTGQGFVHWSANFDEIQDFEGQIRAFAGGTGLMTDAQFNAGTRNQPLGDRKTGISPDLDALAAYLASLTSFDNSPSRNADGTLTAAAAAGRTVFTSAGCASCHGGVGFTLSGNAAAMKDIGTIKATSGQRLGAALTGLDIPTLRDVWRTAPYLHDGSAPTLQAAIQAHRGNTVTGANLDNLVAYLQQIGAQEATAPGSTPPASGTGTGLSGAYFANNNLSGTPVLTRTEVPWFDWGTGAPAANVPADNFSVRWTGEVQAMEAGSYQFRTNSDDGVRVWVNGVQVINNWTVHAPTVDTSGIVTLTAGQRVPIVIEFQEFAGGAVLQLSWLRPGGTWAAVPATQLYAGSTGGTPSAAPPTTAIACGSENATCTLPAGATATVWYGANTSWTSKTGVTGSIACNNATFGDPLVGTVKACRYVVTSTTTPTTPVATPVNLAGSATLATSYVSPWETLAAVNDGVTPANSADHSRGAYGNWQGEALYGRTDWVSFSWSTARRLSAFEVYWWNDSLGIATPTAAQVEYWNGSAWVALGAPGLALNVFNRLDFAAVTTTSIRVSMRSTRATGILEVRVWGN